MEHRTSSALATVTQIDAAAAGGAAEVVVHPAGAALRPRPTEGEIPAPPTRDASPSAVTANGATRAGVAGHPSRYGSEDGSLVTEYGLLAIVAATLAGAVISWASNGAMVTLFNALLRQARALVGA